MAVGRSCLTAGRAVDWKTAVDGAETASAGNLFQTGIVLTKKENLYESRKAGIGWYLKEWLVLPDVG